MERDLQQKFEDISSDTGSKYTHVITYPQEHKLYIRNQDKGRFWKTYCDAVENTELVCIAECPQDHMPFILDMTFRFTTQDVAGSPERDDCDDREGCEDSGDREDDNTDMDYDDILVESFRLRLVSCVQEVLVSVFKIPEPKTELICVVTESEKSWIESYKGTRCVNIAMRIQFPFCRVEPVVVRQLVYPKIKIQFKNKNIIKELSQQPYNDWDDIIDFTAMERPVLMYGSTSSEEIAPRTAYYIYHTITIDVLNGNVDTPALDLQQILKFNNHKDVANRYIDAPTEIETEEYQYWLPLLLSLDHWSKTVEVRNMSEPLKISSSLKASANTVVTDQTDFELCRTFIKMLAKERFTQKAYWTNIGRALFDSTGGSDKGLNEWIDITKRSSGSNPALTSELCRDLYGSMYSDHTTYETLAWYAKEDAPAAFEKWHDAWIEPALEKALPIARQLDNHTDAAEAFKRVFFLKFKYATSPTSKAKHSGRWYIFGGTNVHKPTHRWSPATDGLAIKSAMSDELVKRYESLRRRYVDQSAQSSDDTLKLSLENKITRSCKMIEKLHNQGFKNNIYKEAMEKMHCDYFISVLDENPTCVAHLNCVSEVVDDQIIFRSGKPQDYLSKCTHARIDHTDMSWNHPRVKQYMNWKRQVFPDKELLECFLKFCSSWYVAGNPDKKVIGCTGDRDNSKSQTMKAFEAAWGDYLIKFSTSISTTKGRANGPTPELAQAKGARGAIQDEFEEDDVQQSGFIKRMSGGDSFFARMLNDDGGKIKVTFKFIQVFNKIPRMNSVHPSIKERFWIFPFISTWCDDAPRDPDEQMQQRRFMKDPFFEQQIPGMVNAMHWVWAQYFPKYRKEGLNPRPKIVTDMTREYWDDIDMFEQFKNEFLTEVYVKGMEGKYEGRDRNIKLDIRKVYNEFKEWFRMSYESEKPISLRDFKYEMSKRYGKLSEDKYWYGVILNSAEPVNLSRNKLPQ